MSCIEVRAELFAFQFAEISPEARSAVEAHLLSCPSCLREFLALKREIETADSDPQPSAALHRRLRNSVAAELGLRPAPRRRIWWERPLALTFAAASMTTALLLLHQVTTGPGSVPHGLSTPAALRATPEPH
jgi:anti-sigma factor RsiW